MSLLLARGTRLLLENVENVITEVNLALGCVTLRNSDGADATLSIEQIVNHPGLADLSNSGGPQDAAADRLDKQDRRVMHERVAHVYEVETGYRSGDANRALPCEPKAAYDPSTTTLTQRRRTKAAELDSDAARFARIAMSYATIRRMGKGLSKGRGLDSVVDRRHVRRPAGQFRITERVEQACEDVFERTRTGSNTTARARYMLVHQWLRAAGAEHELPSESTVKRWFSDRFIPSELSGKARSRRSASTAPVGGFSRPNPTRPGELVCIDTCSLDVLLDGTAFAGAVRGVIVMAMDWYSRSILALRVVEGAERAIDVTFVVREIGRPKAMLPGFSDDARWPFVGLPESVLSDVYGGFADGVSGLPVVNTESLVTDHGSTYKAHINVAAAAQHGISLLPARVRSGADKQVVERTFRSMQTMLLQYLSGYRGSDPTERGEDVEAQVKYTVQDVEDVIVHWAVTTWQNHVLSDARPDWCPEGDFSPNTLYQYALAQTGQPLRVLTSADYFALLPTKHVKVHARGVKVRGLWYDDISGKRVLDEPRREPAPYGGAVKGLWTVRYDPRDLRRVHFLDQHGDHLELFWTGATRHTPCFNDRHATALLRLCRDRGIAPHSAAKLAEILLTEILEPLEPVTEWSSLSKTARKQFSKRQRQEQMVERDQAASGLLPFAESFDSNLTTLPGGDEKHLAVPFSPSSQHPTRPSRVTALDEARTQKQAELLPPTEQDGIAPSRRLGADTSMFGFDAAALLAARTAATPTTDLPPKDQP